VIHTELMAANKRPKPKLNLVIECVGATGDPSGGPPKEKAPKVTAAPFIKLDFSCESTLENTKLAKGPPGTTVLAQCPGNCKKSKVVYGSTIYQENSPICSAAIHDGVLPKKGGEIVVTVGHPQDYYVGSEKNDITTESVSNHEKKKSFTVALPSVEMLLRKANSWAKIYAGGSSMGVPIVPKLLS